MRCFQLQRHTDDTGLSGTGIVAQGVEFDDGTVALRWLDHTTEVHRANGVRPTTAIHESIGSVVALHGHGGNTDLVWIATQEATA